MALNAIQFEMAATEEKIRVIIQEQLAFYGQNFHLLRDCDQLLFGNKQPNFNFDTVSSLLFTIHCFQPTCSSFVLPRALPFSKSLVVSTVNNFFRYRDSMVWNWNHSCLDISGFRKRNVQHELVRLSSQRSLESKVTIRIDVMEFTSLGTKVMKNDLGHNEEHNFGVITN